MSNRHGYAGTMQSGSVFERKQGEIIKICTWREYVNETPSSCTRLATTYRVTLLSQCNGPLGSDATCSAHADRGLTDAQMGLRVSSPF